MPFDTSLGFPGGTVAPTEAAGGHLWTLVWALQPLVLKPGKIPHPPRWFPHPTLCPLQSVLLPTKDAGCFSGFPYFHSFPHRPPGSPRVTPKVSFVLISNSIALVQSPPRVTARSSDPKWAVRSSRLFGQTGFAKVSSQPRDLP